MKSLPYLYGQRRHRPVRSRWPKDPYVAQFRERRHAVLQRAALEDGNWTLPNQLEEELLAEPVPGYVNGSFCCS